MQSLVKQLFIFLLIISSTACLTTKAMEKLMSFRNYTITAADGKEYIFSYIREHEIAALLKKDIQIELPEFETNIFPQVYQQNKDYIALFMNTFEGCQDGIVFSDRSFLEKLKNFEFVFFNSDDNFEKLHIMELLNESTMKVFLQKQKMTELKLEKYNDGYTKYFILDDLRCLTQLPSGRGQLYPSYDELIAYEEMIAANDDR